jgi:membrane protein
MGEEGDGRSGLRERARLLGRRVVRSLPQTRQRLADHDLLLLAAGLTFYALIAVVPLLLIAVFLAGAVLGHAEVQGLAQRLGELAPEQLGFSARLVELAAAAAALSPLAVVAALIPATTYGEGLSRAFDRLAGVQTRRKGLRGRLRAVALLGTLPLLVLGAFATVAVLPDLLGVGRGSALLGAYLTFWVAWIGGALLLGVTYRAFSPVTLGTGGLLLAAAGTGSFLAGMSLGWVVVLDAGVAVGRAYGGSEELGAAVLFAVYLFLVQLTCLTGYAWALALDAAPGGRSGRDGKSGAGTRA